VTKLISLGNHKTLELEDIWQLIDEDQSNNIVEQYNIKKFNPINLEITKDRSLGMWFSFPFQLLFISLLRP
jgi:hypothetical protein